MKQNRLAAFLANSILTIAIFSCATAAVAQSSAENAEQNAAPDAVSTAPQAATDDASKEDAPQQATKEAQAAADNATESASQPQSQAVEPAPLEPAATGMPHTEMLDTTKDLAFDPLLAAKPLPPAELALIGGIVRKVDVVHNRITLQPFGGGQRYAIYFDDRTHILSAGRETTVLAIHPGDRLYADSQALGSQVFARTLQVRSVGGPAQASGQVLELIGGQIRLMDRLSGQPIRFLITDRTMVESHGVRSSPSELRIGSLIEVIFTPGGRRSQAQSIVIHASPGESYIFAGTLTHIDLRDGVIALDNEVDGNNYELSFDPLKETSLAKLTIGTPIAVTASFDGARYRAISIKITEAAQP